MGKVKNSTKKEKVAGHLKTGAVTQDPNGIASAITPEELERRANAKRIFDEIETGRRKTKKLPEGVTIDSLIEEGRRF